MPTLISGDEALARLRAGNTRYCGDSHEHPHLSSARRQELAGSQDPFAVVITCADSRVIPELIFDQGIGDLFTIRVAGNILDQAVLGSVEYAVAHLAVNLVVVMGHESCGAVGAAVAGDPHDNSIDRLIEAIAPVVALARADGEDDLVNRTVRLNAQHVCRQMLDDGPVVPALVADRGLVLVPAYYRLGTGRVDFLDG